MIHLCQIFYKKSHPNAEYNCSLGNYSFQSISNLGRESEQKIEIEGLIIGFSVLL